MPAAISTRIVTIGAGGTRAEGTRIGALEIAGGRRFGVMIDSDDVEIGRHCKIRRAIIDKRVVIPPGAQIGVDHERDRANGYTVSPAGVTVVEFE